MKVLVLLSTMALLAAAEAGAATGDAHGERRAATSVSGIAADCELFSIWITELSVSAAKRPLALAEANQLIAKAYKILNDWNGVLATVIAGPKTDGRSPLPASAGWTAATAAAQKGSKITHKIMAAAVQSTPLTATQLQGVAARAHKLFLLARTISDFVGPAHGGV